MSCPVVHSFSFNVLGKPYLPEVSARFASRYASSVGIIGIGNHSSSLLSDILSTFTNLGLGILFNLLMRKCSQTKYATMATFIRNNAAFGAPPTKLNMLPIMLVAESTSRTVSLVACVTPPAIMWKIESAAFVKGV